MGIFDGVFGCIALASVVFKNGCQGEGLIGPTPAYQTLLIGDTHRFNCSRESGVPSTLTWNDDIPGYTDAQIFFGTRKVTALPKYANFEFISDNDDQLDIVIRNVAIEDEGTYYCELAGTQTRQEVTIAVEVRPYSLQMTQNGNDAATVTVTEGDPSEVVCTALGTRPAVDIWWYHQNTGEPEQRIMTGVRQTNTSVAGCTFDTVSTLRYIVNRDYNGGRLWCTTTGQHVAESIEDSATVNVQYSPEVIVNFNNSIVYCSSDAKPVVADNDYLIVVNDAPHYPSCRDGKCTLPLEVTTNTYVRCTATNIIGTGNDVIFVPGAVASTVQSSSATQTEHISGLPGVDFSAVCTSTPTYDDVNIVIKVDDRPTAVNSAITLPTSGCITIECTAIRGSLSTSRKSKICADADPTPGVSIVAVAVPLASVATASVAFAIIAIIRSRRGAKDQYDKPDSNDENQQPNITEPKEITEYMELDARTRENEAPYQQPEPTSPMYEDVAEEIQDKLQDYQQIGVQINKEYSNVPLTI